MTEKRKPTPWLWWTVAGLMLLVAYPLSMGPVAWALHAAGVAQADHWAVKTAELVYAPIIKIAESTPKIDKVTRQYIELWID